MYIRRENVIWTKDLQKQGAGKKVYRSQLNCRQLPEFHHCQVAGGSAPTTYTTSKCPFKWTKFKPIGPLSSSISVGLPDIGTNAPAVAAGNLDFLLNNPQFQALRGMVQANPQIFQPMVQELGKQNPHLVRQIQEHQVDFIRLINEPVQGERMFYCFFNLSMFYIYTLSPPRMREF
ncbi:hypothetical protein L2E82_48180 [Cichorium intybus]|uniref:Uncharacterized protein n=1 Tax=Cichorium intybus TaxID=13427 RepID=A0ACB8YZ17_CICIN|nr:hypothetical protein L2E82_48180 [Cichorium intybus]